MTRSTVRDYIDEFRSGYGRTLSAVVGRGTAAATRWPACNPTAGSHGMFGRDVPKTGRGGDFRRRVPHGCHGG